MKLIVIIIKLYRIHFLHTDASSVALSGVLLKGPSSSELYLVYAVSKQTTQPESKYHSSRL